MTDTVRQSAPARVRRGGTRPGPGSRLGAGPNGLDAATQALVGFAAAIARGNETELARQARRCRARRVRTAWIEELLLQSVLMVGYPRALVAAACWRKVSGRAAPAADRDAGYGRAARWVARGEATCQVVYGANYQRLRRNIRALHPALDAWMIAEGYGRTLSRVGLDLARRELCTVAQTAVLGVPRQLHSHLRGALNAGASPAAVEAALALVRPRLPAGQWDRARRLWQAVRSRSDAMHGAGRSRTAGRTNVH